MNIPTILTLGRMAMIPLFVVIFFFGEWGRQVAAILFLIAGLTDWLDGYLARKLDQTSPFGAFLDPVADKLIVGVALVLLVHAHEGLYGAVVAISAAIIIGREIAISAVREWMALLGARQRVAVVAVAKIKTIVQVIAIFLLLYKVNIGPVSTYDIGVLGLFAAAALTLWSMAIYLRAAWPAIVNPAAYREAHGDDNFDPGA
ncbi:MAG: CDP-diacylglycerol--glycerol-3-phosphate 3-phosphatidyltransferase [Gammaproteobacteria bacterium]|nr:CDP-diacylglycerol--glycerol-3-phosphate 3-phosphatidyltransferase [Gammaproteobacteria bacterium]